MGPLENARNVDVVCNKRFQISLELMNFLWAQTLAILGAIGIDPLAAQVVCILLKFSLTHFYVSCGIHVAPFSLTW